MVASMVSEIILCVKERNKQTRATSFELLVQIAHAMHDAEPPPPGLDYAMADGERWLYPWACCKRPALPDWEGRMGTLFF